MTRQRPLLVCSFLLALAMPSMAEDASAGAKPRVLPAPAEDGGVPFEEPAAVPVDRPRRWRNPLLVPDRPRLIEDEALLIGMVGIGTEKRNDGALVITRRDGQLVDGFGAMSFRRTEHGPRAVRLRTATLSAGTDPLTVREGRFLGDLALEQGAWSGPFTLYDIAAHGGWSQDRRTVLGADLVAGILHVGVERDEHVRSYALGGCVLGSPDRVPFRLSVDRVISYIDGQRRYATEARLCVPLVLDDHLLVYLEGAHIHHGIDAMGANQRVWEGFFGLGLIW